MQTSNHSLTGAFLLGMYIGGRKPKEPVDRWIFDELISGKPSAMMLGIMERLAIEAIIKSNADR